MKVSNKESVMTTPEFEKVRELAEMLTFKRPHNSKSEEAYIEKYLQPLGVERDKYGNLYKSIGDNPSVMFSSHTDTVHKTEGMQKVMFDGEQNELFVDQKNGECLGADDGTGNWIMMEMIRKGVEGLYIFHRGEECGGLGSSWIADSNPEMLQYIDHAIAFDRAFKSDIIRSQSGGRCCSDKFVDHLGNLLGNDYSGAVGTFTDTANYTHIVSECTNLSVGYYRQHSKKETQCVLFADRLRNLATTVDWSDMPVERDPSDWRDDDYYYNGGRGGSYHSGYYGSGYSRTGDDYFDLMDKAAERRFLIKIIEQNPDTVADLLTDNYLGAEDILDWKYRYMERR